MRRDHVKLDEILAPAVTALGYEYVGCDVVTGARKTLRVYIDTDKGVSVDDCTKVSRQVNAVLDVEDPILGKYDLEVSSPGLDRPLFNIDHFVRYVGHKAHVKLGQPLEGRRNFTGEILPLQNEQVALLVDGKTFCFDIDMIEKANLIPDLRF